MKDGFDRILWLKKNHCFTIHAFSVNVKKCYIRYDGSIIRGIVRNVSSAFEMGLKR
ncbi:MAG: hypothetical protein ACP5JP_09840 [bacterium]